MVSTQMVVKSALFHGGHAKSTMVVLHALMSVHAIHVPSPLRLLRLANGKVCEFCLHTKVNHVRPCLGVFACWECVTKRTTRRSRPLIQGTLTKPWKTSWVRYARPFANQEKYDAILRHGRVSAAANRYGEKYYLWSQQRADDHGERVGPIVTLDDVDRIFTHLSSVDVVDAVTIHHYLVNNLNAPPIENYDEFNVAFADSQQRAKVAALERCQIAIVKQAKTKGDKITKAEKILADLSVMIDETYRELAMKRKQNRVFSAKQPCISLDTPFFDSLVKPYIVAPSKLTKKIMAELVASINGKLRLIGDTNLLGMEYLSENDPFEMALKSFLRELLPNVEALFSVGGRVQMYSWGSFESHINDSFFNLLQSGALLDAVIYLTIDKLSPMLLTMEPSAEIARSTAHDEDTLKNLAKTLWGWKHSSNNEQPYSAFKVAFAARTAKFVEALTALDEYSTWLIENMPDWTTEQRTNQLRRNVRENIFLGAVLNREFSRAALL